MKLKNNLFYWNVAKNYEFLIKKGKSLRKNLLYFQFYKTVVK